MGRADQISRRFKLRHLNVLSAVIEHGSMAQAAQHLNVSQPVVSKAISDLETMLAVKLLERGTRGVEPTAYGSALLKRSAIVFDELRASVHDLEYLADPTAGDLRVGSTPATGSGLIPSIIDRMSRQFPRINFEITLAEPWTLEREVRERRIDLAVMGQRISLADDLEMTVLRRDRLHVVAGANHHLISRRKIAIAELCEEYWCLPPPNHPISQVVLGAFRRNGLPPPRATVQVSSAPFTSSLIAHGYFIGVLGSLFLRSNITRPQLRILPVNLGRDEWPTSIVTLKHRTINPVAKLFVDYLRKWNK